MPRYFSTLVFLNLVIALIFLGGCGKPTQESLAKDVVGKMNDLTSILKGITDEASAKAASPKIKAIGDDMQKLQEQAKALPKATAEQEAAMKKTFSKDVMDAMQGMQVEMMRIAKDPKAMAAISDAMKSMHKVGAQ